MALHNIHTIANDIENKEGTYMYGMKSVHYGFPLERWLKVKMSLFCKVRHIFSDNCESPLKTVTYIGQRCVYWIVYEASCRVNWTSIVYFIT